MKIGWIGVLAVVISCGFNEAELIEKEVKIDTVAVIDTVIPPIIEVPVLPSLKEIVDEHSFQVNNISFLIDKSDYKIYACYNDSILKEYPVVLGGNPTDDKLRQGDGCTPEGSFKIRSKYPHSSWEKFIWVDYPNTNSWQKHNAAKKNGKIPSSANIGGEIGIHGVPEGMDFLVENGTNWTLGCISLKIKDLNEIYPYFHKNIVVNIRK